ncbi:MAG: hypothetical protein WBD55_01870 [Dehalococcoidia bacterium]
MRRYFALLLLASFCVSASACLGGGEAKETTVPLPKLTPFDAALELQLAGIATKAAEVRGLELNEDIHQGTLTKQQIGKYYQDLATDARLQKDTNYDALDTTFRLLHMIEPDDSILDVDTEDVGNSILGFYAHEGGDLVLVSDQPEALSLSNEATLAHEYVHSFQDKAYDLSKLFDRALEDERDKANTEYGDTLGALVEGDATVTELEYVKQKVGEAGLRKWLASNQKEAQQVSKATEGPAALGRYTAFPYVEGAAFVRYLYDDGGWDKVNEAYENPPTTEEQILHPEKYVRTERAQDISLRDVSHDLGEGWRQDMDSVFGEFDVYNWLRSTLDNDFQATSAAAGWGGGRLAVYTNELEPDSALLHVAILWDTRQEAREFYITFGDVLKLIDPKPTALDYSYQLVGWDAEHEAGEAWIDGTTFQMVVAVNKQDLGIALDAINAPAAIPQSGYILAENTAGNQTAAPPISRLEDVLLHSGDLPPGYVTTQSGDYNTTSPFGAQNLQQRSVFYSDVRSPGQGVIASATLSRAAVGGGILWSDLARVPPRQLFDGLIRSIVLDGKVTSFSRINAGNVGAGALAARADFQPKQGGPRQRIKMIAFGRGATLIVVATIDDVGSNELDVHQYARLMDERLKRYAP